MSDATATTNRSLLAIETLVGLIDTKTNWEEILQAIETVVKYAEDAKLATETELEAIRLSVENIRAELKDAQATALSEIKTTVEKQLNQAISSFSAQGDALTTEQRRALNFLYDRVTRLQDGTRGEQGPQGATGAPGRDANETVVAEKVAQSLSPRIEEAVAPLKDEIERLKEELRNRPLRVGGGITDLGVRASLGRVVMKETPSGAINGSNTAYTVSRNIMAVLSFVINGEHITDNEYTISGKTITMTTALDASLSGASFRIVYV